MARLAALRRSTSHEDLFVSRYPALLRIALALTRGDRAAAEDLVQDAFVRFTFVRPELRDPDRLDAYFGRMLHNLHLSRLRRSQRFRPHDLSIAEYESAEIGVLAFDYGARTEARQSLARLCDYGCLRRSSSKTGSVFLLRFFLGYVPSEIAAILRVPGSMVDNWLRLARQEARVFLDDPSRLRFASTSVATPRAAPRDSSALRDHEGDDEDLLRELRARIFATPHRRCFSDRTLERLYRQEPVTAIETATLAEIVSCASCLARVSAMLSLPPSSSRDPIDTLGTNHRSRGRTPPKARGPRPTATRQRVRDLFEHKPKTLRVLVNGFPAGEQAVADGDTAFTIALNPPEPIGLVEIFSEQDLCLAYLDVDAPPNAPAEQTVTVELSGDRRLSLTVSFAEAWPSLHLEYSQARHANEASIVDVQEWESEATPLSTADTTPGWRARLSALRAWFAIASRQPLFSARAFVIVALLAWLFFATPFADVSAAQYVGRWLQRVATRTLNWLQPRPPTAALPPLSSFAIPGHARASYGALPYAPRSRSMSLSIEPRVSDVAADTLALRVLAQLQDVRAYLGQEVTLARGSNGGVRIDAIVDSESRRRELLDAMASFDASALSTRVRTARFVRGRSSSARPSMQAPVREYTFTPDDSPAFARLRTFFASRGNGASHDRQVQADVDAFATRVLAESRRASQHAWALQHVMERFAPLDVARMPIEAHAAWTRIVRTHARRYLDEIDRMRADVAPIFRPDSAPIADRERSSDDRRLADAATSSRSSSRVDAGTDTLAQLESWARRLFELNAVQDDAFGALSVSSDARSAYVLEDAVFWRQFDELASIASRMQGEGRP